MPQLTAALVPSPDQVVVRLTGEADLSTAAVLSEALYRAEAHGGRVVVVDVSRARFWDCSGLHALAGLTARLRAGGRECRLVGATAATRRLIAVADLSAAIELDGPAARPSPPGHGRTRRTTRRPTAPAWTLPAAAAVSGRPHP